ncbi:hypothetical protein [Ulvibacterium sp.]|uniref:hypothetical protein n=1 Tax=Ulvibacterium sp. TaxID=2665914 RepID=UPI0026252E6F|nr:hypothetical protein [Ulvibacterium sp.]
MSIIKLKASDIIEIDDEFLELIVRKMDEYANKKKLDKQEVFNVSSASRYVGRSENTLRIHIRNHKNNTPGKKLKANKPKGSRDYILLKEDLDQYMIRYNIKRK